MQRATAIVQARCGSKRLPRKVLANICGRPLIIFLLERLSLSKLIDQIILATTSNTEDDELTLKCQEFGVQTFRGSENDVLDRYQKAASLAHNDTIVRITGDCPLIDPTLVDKTIQEYWSQQVDYLSNANPPTFPDGLDTEVFSKKTLEKAHRYATSKVDKEHVTTWIRSNNELKLGCLKNNEDCSKSRWTVDEPEDLEVIRGVINEIEGLTSFTWRDIMQLEKKNPEIFRANKHILRNEGATKSSGQKLWKRAKKVIPGGNMLLSKRAEMFLPDKWPTYFSRSKGCYIFDIDNIKYIDMSIMGIGTNLLGYCRKEVDNAVINVASMGNMSTLNCPEEVYLAEKLVEMHKWSDMVRFARTGGEANSIAIRIARAATGRDKVAICGYHGWHDWYLATNLNNKDGLSEHLLEGLEAIGLPKALAGSALAFKYNDTDELRRVTQNTNLAAIIMEVQRSEAPRDGFLQEVRKICDEKNIVLIFDECSSGFRETFGGLHIKFGVEPDMAMFGKTLGNGYAITAVIGKRDVMQAAQKTFISSTFWTERIGPTAALEVLSIMEKERSWETVTRLGNNIIEGWKEIAKHNQLELTINGIPALAGFRFKSADHMKYKTLITQEMLKQGYLATDRFYASTAHEGKLEIYLEKLNNVFKLIAECEEGRDINKLLDGPVCHTGFQRLN